MNYVNVRILMMKEKKEGRGEKVMMYYVFLYILFFLTFIIVEVNNIIMDVL